MKILAVGNITNQESVFVKEVARSALPGSPDDTLGIFLRVGDGHGLHLHLTEADCAVLEQLLRNRKRAEASPATKWRL